MITEQSYNEYKDVMAKLLTVVKKLRLLEENLTNAASGDKTEDLERLVKDAQPLLMEFRGQDRRRSQVEKSLGITGKTFAKVLSLFSEDQQKDLSPILNGLTTELHLYENAKEAADKIMNVRLRDVNDRLQDLPQAPVQFRDRLV